MAALAAAAEPGRPEAKVIRQEHLEACIRDVIAGKAVMQQSLFEVDPSHITLLNKDMLRLMFVLEGCRSRPDLEARMDWGNKGRVLVLEKAVAAP